MIAPQSMIKKNSRKIRSLQPKHYHLLDRESLFSTKMNLSTYDHKQQLYSSVQLNSKHKHIKVHCNFSPAKKTLTHGYQINKVPIFFKTGFNQNVLKKQKSECVSQNSLLFSNRINFDDRFPMFSPKRFMIKKKYSKGLKLSQRISKDSAKEISVNRKNIIDQCRPWQIDDPQTFRFL